MGRVYWMETKSEFLKLLRLKTYSLTVVSFPLMFYCFFALGMTRQQGPLAAIEAARYLLCTYGSFAIVSAAMFALGVGTAVERGLGWLEVKRASPMPTGAYITAKSAASMAFGGIAILLLFLLGAFAGGVVLPAGQWLLLLGTLLAGALPFCAIGLVVGTFAGPNSAPGIVNMIYLPMAFAGGLWIPFHMLPKAIQQAGQFLPTYHLGQLALSTVHTPSLGTTWQHIGALAAFTAIFGGIAWLANARQREKMYG